MKCWGGGGSGELGNGATTDRSAPVTVHTSASNANALGSVRSIEVGTAHTCALLVNGTIKCWGAGVIGQLGDGMSADRSTPVTVRTSSSSASALSNVSAIAAGGYHTCALLANGTMKCWGYSDYGQLGDGTETERYAPVTVHSSAVGSTALSGVSAIAGGGHHTCALLASGTVKCWGWGSLGQLGDGAKTDRSAPITVHASSGTSSALSGVGQRAIAVGFGQTCALLVNGTVKCWGANFLGEVGDGTTTQRKAPVTVKAGGGSSVALSNVVAIAAGGFYTCALLVNGTVMCWGADYDLDPVVVVSGPGSSTALSNVVAIAAGSHHTCALLAAGTLKCWGNNDFGQVGDGTKTGRTVTRDGQVGRRQRVALSGVRAVAAGQFHTCAVLAPAR